MSAVLKLPSHNGKPCRIFLIYDFKQVKDLILMVMYVDKLNTWKKVFVIYENGKWRTSVFASYLDKKTYMQVCNKLRLISPIVRAPTKKALNLEQTMKQEAAFILNVCS